MANPRELELFNNLLDERLKDFIQFGTIKSVSAPNVTVSIDGTNIATTARFFGSTPSINDRVLILRINGSSRDFVVLTSS